mmetsp:Transcript_6220/g.9149  ORF Transcript_6220/g.9149 Transcript_6220/m.9149 type:complete len:204 (-) Transcript_6220:239-850(-)
MQQGPDNVSQQSQFTNGQMRHPHRDAVHQLPFDDQQRKNTKGFHDGKVRNGRNTGLVEIVIDQSPVIEKVEKLVRECQYPQTPRDGNPTARTVLVRRRLTRYQTEQTVEQTHPQIQQCQHRRPVLVVRQPKTRYTTVIQQITTEHVHRNTGNGHLDRDDEPGRFGRKGSLDVQNVTVDFQQRKRVLTKFVTEPTPASRVFVFF